jgi:hypothetical protein
MAKSVTFEPVTKCQLQLQAKLPTKLPKSLNKQRGHAAVLNFYGVSIQQAVSAGGGSKAEEPTLFSLKKKIKNKNKQKKVASRCTDLQPIASENK